MQLRDTKWLANRLGISLSTVEKLRSENSEAIPAAITIGKTIRYGDTYVEWWLQRRMLITVMNYNHWLNEQMTLNNKSTGNTEKTPNKTKEIQPKEDTTEDSKVTATPRFYKAKASQNDQLKNTSKQLKQNTHTYNKDYRL